MRCGRRFSGGSRDGAAAGAGAAVTLGRRSGSSPGRSIDGARAIISVGPRCCISPKGEVSIPLEKDRRVPLHDDLRLEIEARGETQVFMVGACVAISAPVFASAVWIQPVIEGEILRLHRHEDALGIIGQIDRPQRLRSRFGLGIRQRLGIGQAQGFLVLVTYGVGMLIGTQVAGWVFNNVVTGDVAGDLGQWRTFWWIPAAFAAAVAAFFALAFDDRVDTRLDSDSTAADTPAAEP